MDNSENSAACLDAKAASDGPESKSAAPLVFALLVILTAYPPLRSYQTSGMLAPFRFFAVDAFYYLGVAERSVGKAFFTFDGEHATNGFHPLWQVYLRSAFGLFGLVGNQKSQLLFAFFSSVALVSLGAGFFGLGLVRMIRNPAAAILCLIPGPYYFLTRIHGMGLHYGAIWSYENGMESPFSIFFGGLLIWLMSRNQFIGGQSSIKNIILYSMLITLITLSRLDDIFMFIPFLCFVAWSGQGTPKSTMIARIGYASLPPALLLGSYMGYNIYWTGSPLPLSGIAKAGPALLNNMTCLGQAFVPFDLFLKYPGDYVDMTWRALQMALPLGAAIVILYRAFRKVKRPGGEKWGELDVAYGMYVFLAMYVACKAFYNLVNVKDVHQGHWYYPLSIIFLNMCVTAWAVDLWKNRPAQRGHSARLLPACLLGFASVYYTLSFTNLKRGDPYQTNLFNLWQEGGRLQKELRTRYDGKGFIEFDDGIISYALNIPAMSGLGFTLDREAFEAKERGELLKVAYERGFRMFTSLQYMGRVPLEADSSPNLLRRFLRSSWFMRNSSQTREEGLDPWDFKVLFRDPVTKLVFIEFFPREREK
ncbi:hypothetical protein HYR69_10415 [Candidatus Sumerlaeota bacterium]|nr:hypothetical protein [Candidatus Sumerlaeota bacterium]MBI3737027.1 hypothetical protein [Candidatus Sumerlaeota bacterium]